MEQFCEPKFKMNLWEGEEHPKCTDTQRVKDLNSKILSSEWDSNPQPH